MTTTKPKTEETAAKPKAHAAAPKEKPWPRNIPESVDERDIHSLIHAREEYDKASQAGRSEKTAEDCQERVRLGKDTQMKNNAPATPGSKRLRVNLVRRLRHEMENFYATGHLSELLLLQDALLMADNERSIKNAGNECAIGNAIADFFGVNAFAA